MDIISLEDYNIYLGPTADSLSEFLGNQMFSQIIVLVDENTETNCLPLLRESLQKYPVTTIRIPAGEAHKNIETCQFIWGKMMEAGADRKSILINLGGGVIGDMGGFCAGTFKRGIHFIQIPTTLLSQVDASIGGKLGIDFQQVKNSIGLFKNPEAVFIDEAFLKTLPSREIRSGFAEILKHSLIADQKQWEALKQLDTLENMEWLSLIKPSVKIKRKIVNEDPFEKGIRKALNFGHTIGHAIEGHLLETDQPLLHGEAIAIGMICESYLSHQDLQLPKDDLEQISRFIISLYGHRTLEKKDYPAFLALMRNDKKNESGQINFSLIPRPGAVEVNKTCEEALIIKSLDYYNAQVP